MTPMQAKKRYFKVFVPSMAAYIITIFSVVTIIKSTELPVWVQYGLAIIPALCVWLTLWAHGRYIMETDEYDRHRQTQAVMIAAAVTLTFSTGWGLLEMLVDAPKFPVFYIFVLFCAAYSGGCAINALRGKTV